ncbi:chymotrypsin family serine protease [Hamadaea tsunoensis]|uniref:hypothetical protein n=1 Tax=Hamadaea tsunoensis TaxID=53368 RepID=UPI0003FE9580|nr:hypothetical protein [Hamadaea tsunoensis]
MTVGVREKKRAGALLALVLLSTFAVGTAQAAPPAADCTVAGAAAGTAASLKASGGVPDSDGLYPFQKWLVDPATQSKNRSTQAATESALKIKGSSDRDRLAGGLVGYAADENAQSIVTVVTADYADPAGLASSTGARVQRGCFTAAQLSQARDVLLGRAWHPDAAKASFSGGLDPADSRYHVTVDAAYPQVADALVQALGDRVVVELGAVGRTGRLNDGEPHYGGAGIRKGYNANTASNTCTSGFVVSKGGKRGVSTAAHCFANGDSVYSSTQFAGVGTDRPADLSAWDLMWVSSTSETYDNVIHVEPCSPCTRTVVGTRMVAQNDVVCVSGMVSGALCSIVVTSVGTFLCDSAGCTSGLISGTRNGDTIVRAGDSGGPVYERTGTASAIALGSIVGGSGGRSTTGTRILMEPVSAFAGLGLSILTS